MSYRKKKVSYKISMCTCLFMALGILCLAGCVGATNLSNIDTDLSLNSANNLSQALASDLQIELSDAGVDTATVDTIVDSALSQSLAAEPRSGNISASASPYAIAASSVIKGALKGFKKSSIATLEARKIIIKIISYTPVKSMSKRYQKINTESDKAVLSSIATSAVSNLDETGLASNELSVYASIAVQGPVEYIDDAGYSNEDIGELIEAVSSGAITGLGGIDSSLVQGFSAASFVPLAAAIAGGAVEGINKIDNIEQQTLKSSLEGISSGAGAAIVNLQTTDSFDSTLAASMLGSISEGATKSIDTLTVQGSLSNEDLIGSISGGTVTAVANLDSSFDESFAFSPDLALAELSEGINQAISEANLTLAEGSAVSSIINESIETSLPSSGGSSDLFTSLDRVSCSFTYPWGPSILGFCMDFDKDEIGASNISALQALCSGEGDGALSEYRETGCAPANLYQKCSYTDSNITEGGSLNITNASIDFYYYGSYLIDNRPSPPDAPLCTSGSSINVEPNLDNLMGEGPPSETSCVVAPHKLYDIPFPVFESTYDWQEYYCFDIGEDPSVTHENCENIFMSYDSYGIPVGFIEYLPKVPSSTRLMKAYFFPTSCAKLGAYQTASCNATLAGKTYTLKAGGSSSPTDSHCASMAAEIEANYTEPPAKTTTIKPR
jgi:hypothetical protein